MSGVGFGGTLFSIFCGFCFTALSMILIINRLTFEEIGVPQEFCIASSILIFGYGILMILLGRNQIKGIKEGKDYPGPSEGILL
jgi:hypothetical protein